MEAVLSDGNHDAIDEGTERESQLIYAVRKVSGKLSGESSDGVSSSSVGLVLSSAENPQKLCAKFDSARFESFLWSQFESVDSQRNSPKKVPESPVLPEEMPEDFLTPDNSSERGTTSQNRAATA